MFFYSLCEDILMNCNLMLMALWQAYTLELEAEIAKLREMNQELQKKQVCQ